MGVGGWERSQPAARCNYLLGWLFVEDLLALCPPAVYQRFHHSSSSFTFILSLSGYIFFRRFLLFLFLSSSSFVLSAFPPLLLFHTVEYTGVQKQKWSLLLIIISFTCLTLIVFAVLWSSCHTCSCERVSRAEVPVTCVFFVSSSIEGISEAESQQRRPYPVTGR